MLRITLQISIALVILFTIRSVAAQELTNKSTELAAAPVITVAASAARLRFTAPNSVVQMHLQVYAETGQTVFDVTSKGNVLDWTMQDGSGEHLIPGSYLCVITVKSLSGRLSQRIGSALVQEKQVELQRMGATELTPAQQQAVGPIEENAALTILKADEAEAVTVLSNNGREGQITRDRGALSFRLGDFFSGDDQEQMRLTEDGRLGIGTNNPQAALDVAGAIHTTNGIEFADGTVQTTGLSGRKDKDGNVVPNASGSGTQGRLAKWTDNAGTLGDSVLVDTGTGLQLTAAPSSSVDTNVIFMNGSDRTTGMIASPTASFSSANGPFFAMRGNTYSAISGQRGLFAMSAGNVSSPTGREGSILFNTGNDQIRMLIDPSGNVGIGTTAPTSVLHVVGKAASNGANAAPVLQVIGGDGASGLPPGKGANVLLQAGNGGNTTGGVFSGGQGGSITLQPGLGGTAELSNGQPGNLLLAPGPGGVGIGTTTPSTKLTVIGSASFSEKVQIGAFQFGPPNTLSVFGTADVAGNLGIGTTAPVNPLSVVGNANFTGNVGIGITAPVNPLSVVGNADFSGNVGIGTTVPEQTLHVNGNSEVLSTGNGSGFKFRNRGSGSANDDWVWYSSSNIARFFRAGVGDLLVVTTAGNLGVGATSPTAKLQVSGGDAAITTQGNGLILRATNGGTCYRVTVNNTGTLSTTPVACP